MDAIERIIERLETEREALNKAIEALRGTERRAMRREPPIVISDFPAPKLRRGSLAWKQHLSEAAKRRWRNQRAQAG